MFNSVLIANRGEIALRILTTLKELNIESVILSSPIDQETLPVKLADKVLVLPGNLPSESYLNYKYFLPLARELGVDAVHPGYGFLSENSHFRDAVGKSKMSFVGPTKLNMEILGDKVKAREAAIRSGTPLLPGVNEILEAEELKEVAKNIGFPVMIKAAAGGGGRGIRVVENESNFISVCTQAQNEAEMAFGDRRVYLEKFLTQARHIEVQLLGLNSGSALHYGERDCSIQRKNQKIIEESPSPYLTKKKAKEIHEIATNLAEEVGYINAGTAEFLSDSDRNFYFMEVNTRIQVEHPVSEFVTNSDLIKQQLLIASGEDPDINQKDIKFKGHAIEARVYAENPYLKFKPSPGEISEIEHPNGNGIRVDTHMENGSTIPSFYDSMISKVISYSDSRMSAINKLSLALSRYKIYGVHTTIPIIYQIINSEEFKTQKYDIKFLDSNPNRFQIPKELLSIADVAAVSMADKIPDRESKNEDCEEDNWRWSYIMGGQIF